MLITWNIVYIHLGSFSLYGWVSCISLAFHTIDSIPVYISIIVGCTLCKLSELIFSICTFLVFLALISHFTLYSTGRTPVFQASEALHSFPQESKSQKTVSGINRGLSMLPTQTTANQQSQNETQNLFWPWRQIWMEKEVMNSRLLKKKCSCSLTCSADWLSSWLGWLSD